MTFEKALENVLLENKLGACDPDDLYTMLYLDDHIYDYDNPLYWNLMLSASLTGIYDLIYSGQELNDAFYEQSVRILENKCGITHENAEWTVKTCFSVYGETILHHKNYCSYRLSGSEKEKLEVVRLSAIEEGEKLPKFLIERVISAEKKLNINDIVATVKKSSDGIDIVGEVTGSDFVSDFIIYVMVFNLQNELIGASFRTQVSVENNPTIIPFSANVALPMNESISKIIFRPIADPLIYREFFKIPE